MDGGPTPIARRSGDLSGRHGDARHRPALAARRRRAMAI
jgi:hypothetical protein